MAIEPPNRRRALLILHPDALRRIQTEPEGRMLVKAPGLVITSSDKNLEGDGLHTSGGWFEEGRMYLQSPFQKNFYAEATEANNIFAVERQQVFLRFCQALGLRSLEVLQVNRSTVESTQSIGGGVAKGVEIKAKTTSGQEDQFVRTLRTKDIFSGGPPDITLAERILEEVNLTADLEFSSLINLMRGINPLREREYELTVTRSGQQQLSLAASLKVPAYAKLSVDYGTKLRVREECQVRLRLVFGSPGKHT